MLVLNTNKTVRKGKTYNLQSLFNFEFDSRLSESEKESIMSSLTWKGNLVVGDQIESIQKVDPSKGTPRSLSLLSSRTENSILIPTDTEGKIALEASFQIGEEIITTEVTFNLAEDLSQKQASRATQLKSVRTDKSRVVREKYNRIRRE